MANNVTAYQLAAILRRMPAREIKLSEIEAFNAAAFETRGEAISNINRDMITRNRFTVGSIRVDKASLSRPYAEVGSIAEYMRKQERGAVEDAGGEGVVVPTSTASGEGRANPRRKLVRRPNQVASITLPPRLSNGSRAQRNVVAVKRALKSGKRVALLETDTMRGFFRVVGPKRNARVEMLHDLSRRSVSIPASPWLSPAATLAAREIPLRFYRALSRRLPT